MKYLLSLIAIIAFSNLYGQKTFTTKGESVMVKDYEEDKGIQISTNPAYELKIVIRLDSVDIISSLGVKTYMLIDVTVLKELKMVIYELRETDEKQQNIVLAIDGYSKSMRIYKQRSIRTKQMYHEYPIVATQFAVPKIAVSD
jgi:hypothetical protein